MAGKFSDWDHVGCFLQLDSLGIYKSTLVVYDHVRVQGTLVLPILVQAVN
jgi:hypothetical protein